MANRRSAYSLRDRASAGPAPQQPAAAVRRGAAFDRLPSTLPFERATTAKRVFFDGMNLALTRGTGIATYTRVLAKEARRLGHQVGFLYGAQRALPRDELAREVEFFDSVVHDTVPSRLLPLMRAGDTLRDLVSIVADPAGVPAESVPLTDAVMKRALGSRWTDCDHLYAARRVFERARRCFACYGQLLPVNLPIGVDLFHWTYPITARANARTNIYTVHDIVPVRLPYTTLDWKRFHLSALRSIFSKADHIVTVSEKSKRDMMKLFGIEERRITNTYQAIDLPDEAIARSDDDVAFELTQVFGLEARNYLIYYGSIEPKKNLARLLESYIGARIDMPLVIVAAQRWGDHENWLRNDSAMRESGRIRWLEYLPPSQLATLVKGARALVFPSLYEGFGLPVLEAMTLGTPVLTSTESSIPELAEGAALMVDPYDGDAIRRGIVEIATDDGLWTTLRAAGLVRAGLFSREVYRARLQKLYASLM